MTQENQGCPYCDWDGEVARTHDRTHNYSTHVVVRDGELFKGKTCSMRTSPETPSLWSRLVELITPEGQK